MIIENYINKKISYFFYFTLCSLFPLIIAGYIRPFNNFLFHSILIASGWLTWTYLEYFYHRFAMHPRKKNGGTKISKNHFHHHHSPHVFEVNTIHRVLLCTTCAFLFILSHKLDNYFSFLAGLLWGFTAFCLIHYLLHLRWVKRILPRHHYFHICHHCKFPDKCYGVSVTWWDYIFATTPPKNFKISTKATDIYYL